MVTRISPNPDDLAADPDAWSAQLPALPRPHPRQLPALRSLREELRSALQQPTRLDTLLAHAALRLRYHPDQPGRLRHEAGDPSSTSDAILGAVADAITSGDWPRLKACRDCRWVFYDHSKNTSRTWCSMTAQGGRACGSIAKTRTYRQRQKGQDPIDL